jgi:hypothetical protein
MTLLRRALLSRNAFGHLLLPLFNVMLFVLLLSVNVATAATKAAATAIRFCWEAPDKLDLPSCTVRDK